MDVDQATDLLDTLVKKAIATGADQADAVAATFMSISHARRLGKVEKLERSESHDLGLRVIIGQKQAVVSSNDWQKDALDSLVDRAIAMARAVPDDAFCGLADPEQLLSNTPPELDVCDTSEPSAEDLVERATRAEEAAMAVQGVTNSEGAEADWSRWDVVLAASNGFRGAYAGSRSGVGVSVLAGEGVGMESDYDYSTKVYGADLRDPAEVGKMAGDKAVRKLNPRKGPTKSVPVIFDPRIAGSILRHLTGAINGSSVARGTSFLKDMMGKQILSKGITIIDDPHRPRGLASKPFDAEGLANKARPLVEDGVLQTWILDLHTARQLELESTGHASRGTGGPPSPSTTNVHLEPGSISRDDLIGGVQDGFYVTSLMGMGVNGITGDYSRGASGFWIEGGEIVYPVNEMTIASNLKEMFMHMTAANDLEFTYATNAPTLMIEGMMVAGQ